MQRILLSALVMGGVVAAAIYGTTAFFSDTETSTGNTFTAGSVDLTIDSLTVDYNGVQSNAPEIVVNNNENENGFFFTVDDIKPLDNGTISYQLTNEDNQAEVCALVTDATPAPEANDTALAGMMNFLFGTESGTVSTVAGQWQSLGIMEPTEVNALSVDYCFGVYDGTTCVLDDIDYNPAQLGQMVVDLEFYAEQTRNNPDFDCSDLNPEPLWTNAGTVSGGEANFVQEDGRGTVLQLVTVDDNASRVRWENMSLNLGLSTLTGIDFDTKQVVAPNQPVSNATMRLFIDLDGDTNTADVQEIVYEPYYNIQAHNPLNDIAMILGNWHTWKTTLANGKFWANDGFLGATPNGGAYATNFTLQQVLDVHPSALIVGVNLGMGTWNPGQTILVDNLIINGAPVSLEN
jgi:predicted ribosomally synthesized peptide with SipW-like signal peptide